MRGKLKCRHYMQALDSVKTHVIGESMTRQDKADLVNINKIYQRTQRGEIVLANNKMPEFGDYSLDVTYEEALNAVIQAEEAFNNLPSHVRKQYGNDPEVYYQKVLEEAAEAHNNKVKKQVKLDKEKREQEKVLKAKELLNIKEDLKDDK